MRRALMSPAGMRKDTVRLLKAYYDAGVGEYWIVDADARVIERWLPGDTRPEIIADILEWQPAGAPEAFVLSLPSFFDQAVGSVDFQQ